MTPTSEDIADLTPEEKRALLVKLLKQRAIASQSPAQLAPEPPGRLDRLAINVSRLRSQAVLDPRISPQKAAKAGYEDVSEPAHVLLTGSTGFLGSFLLLELLQETEAHIHCLVRCSSPQEGAERIERTLGSYAPGGGLQGGRITAIPGDLSKPLLGLSEQRFRALAERVDRIYHCGASVNWIYPYDRLKPANVLGTQEVLRLACSAQPIPVHYVSTISVFPMVSDTESTVVHEGDSLDHGGILYGGYTQSKWVAEALVAIARSRGLPVAVYRPGLISGHSQTGAWNTDDVFCTIIKSWIELRRAPDIEAATDLTPVDYVSRAIVHLSLSPQSLGQVFHLVNPQPVHARDLADWVRSFGYPVEAVPYERWRAQLVKLAKGSPDNAAHSLAPLFSVRLSEDAPEAGLRQDDTLDGLGTVIVSQYARMSVRFDASNALAALSSTAIECPPVDSDLLHTYLALFVRRGFLQPPPSEGDNCGHPR
jgi:thioester reductase-like protein